MERIFPIFLVADQSHSYSCLVLLLALQLPFRASVHYFEPNIVTQGQPKQQRSAISAGLSRMNDGVPVVLEPPMRSLSPCTSRESRTSVVHVSEVFIPSLQR